MHRGAFVAFLLCHACSGERPATLGTAGGQFPPCPDAANCVSSDDSGSHAIAPFRFTDSALVVWPRIVEAVELMPRTTIVTRDSNYLHAEVRSRLFRFVDDLELHLRPADSLIAVRSAARSGNWDLGANRRRAERLRRMLLADGIIWPLPKERA